MIHYHIGLDISYINTLGNIVNKDIKELEILIRGKDCLYKSLFIEGSLGKLSKEAKKLNLYKPEHKEPFLERYEESTQKNIRRYFDKAYKLENHLDKDICNFNKEELRHFLKGMQATTVQYLHTIVSAIANYIDYATCELRINEHGDNRMRRHFNSAEILEPFLHYQAKQHKHINRKTLHYIMKSCANAQDSALFGIFFESATSEEAINLREEDIKGNKVTLRSVDKEKKTKMVDRTIVIEDELILEALRDAIKQEGYEKNNGQNENMDRPIAVLAQTDFIFRPSGKNKQGKISKNTLYDRIKKVSEHLGFEYKYLNANNLAISGHIEFAKKIKAERGKLTMEDYILINKTFGYSEKLWYNTKRRIARYLDNIEVKSDDYNENSEFEDGYSYLIEDDIEFSEGDEKLKQHISRERNPKIKPLFIEKFKKSYGKLFCEACDFDFEEVYGERGKGYIECHHTIPISEMPKGYKTKLEDIALVCSNCHSMIHRQRPWLSIDDLKKIIQSNR